MAHSDSSSYSGSGTASGAVPSPHFDPVTGVSYNFVDSASSSYSESGAYHVNSEVSTTFAGNPDGSWLATQINATTQGADIGSYHYAYHTSTTASDLTVASGATDSGRTGNTGSVFESHNYGFGGNLQTIVPSLGASATLSGQVHGTDGGATGSQSASSSSTWANADGFSGNTTYSSADTYHYLPSRSQSFDASGKHESYIDPGKTSGTMTLDPAPCAAPSGHYSQNYANNPPGFDTQDFYASSGQPVSGPAFGPTGGGPQFGYNGVVPPPTAPQSVSAFSAAVARANAYLSDQTGGRWDAFKAEIFLADINVQTAFNNSLVDRGLGTADAGAAFLTSGVITSVGGPVFDPANRQNARTVAGYIYLTAAVLAPGAGALDGLFAERGAVQAVEGVGAATSGEGGAALGAGEGLAPEGEYLATNSEATSKWVFAGSAEQNAQATNITEWLTTNFEKSGGKWDVQASAELGANGLYDPLTNTITLTEASTRGTLLEELLHFRQAQRIGVVYKPWPTGIVPLLEEGKHMLPVADGGVPYIWGARTALRELLGFVRVTG